jgi:predicted RecB family nuclease
MDKNGKLTHEEFLHEGLGDPREPFARSLLETLGTSGSIVVYSPFEATRIRELAEVLPLLSKDLQALLVGRIVDLLQLMRKHCYHPEFHGSFSLKSVLPALVPGLDYSDLEIRDGDQASTAYAEMVQQDTPTDRRRQLRESLLAYCKRDTEAMVRLFNTLRGNTAC